jgi:glycolate oxidase
MADLASLLEDLVGAANVAAGDEISEDYAHDEALSVEPQRPAVVVRPGSTDEVSQVLKLASETKTPVTARGSATGLSAGALPDPDGIVLSLERFDKILEIDADNHVAVVQAGVTLAQLDEALAPLGLVYPVQPGEMSGSLGGNVATNAGGMRAVKYGVTRSQILGLEAVLATGEVIRTGGRFVKCSSGYDLTQLLCGSEGTLAVVTEVTVKVHPRLEHRSTLLVPFTNLDQVTAAIPRIVASGRQPLILEYIDAFTMTAITAHVGLELGIPQSVKETAFAYLVIVLESGQQDRLDEDSQALAELSAQLDSIDVFMLPPTAGAQLISAREAAFWAAKAVNANDIVDVVVPRAQIPEFFRRVAKVQTEHETVFFGCGHAGDGNVHLSVFQADETKRKDAMRALFAEGIALGGAISGEHGIGRAKKPYFLEFEDPVKLRLMQEIKRAFDPDGILNPGVLLDT